MRGQGGRLDAIPEGEAGTPFAGWAALAVFLASPAAASVTGQTVTIDGGVLMYRGSGRVPCTG